MSAARRTSGFNDATPVTITLTTTLGRVRALIDSPHTLTEDRPGAYYANAVRAGIRDLRNALARAEESTNGETSDGG